MAKAEIYTSGTCMYCVAAKNLLKQNGIAYEEVRVEADPARSAEMLARTGARSLPQVFIDGRHVGGYHELEAAARAGTLDASGEDAA